MTQLQITRSAVRKPQGRRRKSCPFLSKHPRLIIRTLSCFPDLRRKEAKLFHLVSRLSLRKNSVNCQPPLSVRGIWLSCLMSLARKQKGISRYASYIA